jgi:hypothetical protein
MNWFSITLIAICVVLVILPPKWDPAIRFKEWNYKRQKGKS